MAKDRKKRKGRGTTESPMKGPLPFVLVFGGVIGGVAVWACRVSWHLFRPEDLVPVLLTVVAFMAAFPAMFGRLGKGEGRHLDLGRALGAQAVACLLLLLLTAYALPKLVPERLDAKRAMAATVKRALEGDPLAVEIQKAYQRAATGAVGESYQSPELDEAMDSARHFVYGWLSHDLDHAETFCLESLRPKLRRATLPKRLIEKPSEVPLNAIVIEGHSYDGKNMRLKLGYGDWHCELLLQRDFGWQVASLP